MTRSWLVHVIDDDEMVRTALAFALQAFGFRAIDYVDAADYLLRGRGEPGVLVSDVRMPGMSGIELTRLVRQDDRTIPIILLTGHVDCALEKNALAAGADRVMGKPVALDALLAEIARVTTGWA